MTAPRLVLSIVLPLGLALLVCLAVATSASWWLISRVYEQQIQADIDADIALLKQRYERLKVVAIVDAIDYRLYRALSDRTQRVYSLVDSSGRVITGNIEKWPVASQPQQDTWLRFRSRVDGRDNTVLARVEQIDGYYDLLVGRTLEGATQFQYSVAKVLALTAVGLFLGLVAITLGIGMKINRRFVRIGDAIELARSGDRRARAPEDGRDEITRLSQQVNEMLATIHRQIFHLRDISRVIAHEFRTPLSRQKRLLEQETEQHVSTRLEDCLVSVDGLLELSHSLLEIAENETGYYRAGEQLNLATVVQDQTALFSEVCEDKRLHLAVVAQPCHVFGDRWLLVRLVANLVDNAITVSREGQTVQVECFPNGAKAVVRVVDQGGGVQIADLDGLIAASASKPVGERVDRHAGIGLRMVKAIALRHGASVNYNNISSGVEVLVTFPIATTPD